MAALTIDTDVLAAIIAEHRLQTSTAAYYGYMDGHGPSEIAVVGVAVTAAANTVTPAEAKDLVKDAWNEAERAHKAWRDSL